MSNAGGAVAEVALTPARLRVPARLTIESARRMRNVRARRARRDAVSATAAGTAAAATRRTCGRSTGLFALPQFDRLAAKAPVAADAEPRQSSLPEQAIDRRRMNPQMLRQFLDGENLIALSCLRHSLNRLAWGGDFLRRPFLHSPEPWNSVIKFSLCCGVSGVKTLCANDRSNPREGACENAKVPSRQSLLNHF